MWFFTPTVRVIGDYFSSKLRVHSRNFETDPKSDLAAVGHGLDLLAAFPWFRLVPRHLRSAMIVWIADEGCWLLRSARSQRDHECAQQDGNDDGSDLMDLCQHKLRYLQVVLGRLAPSCW